MSSASFQSGYQGLEFARFAVRFGNGNSDTIDCPSNSACCSESCYDTCRPSDVCAATQGCNNAEADATVATADCDIADLLNDLE